MERDYLTEFEAGLVGRTCSLQRREHDWLVSLGQGSDISVEGPWRILAGGKVALGSGDDGERFGRETPLDAEQLARELLGSNPIIRASVDRRTADLSLSFDPDTRLDILTMSAGYEGWQASLRVGDRSLLVVALGGGDISIWA